VERVLEASGLSVAPPSRRSQRLVPQAPDQGSNLESRPRRTSEASEQEDDDEMKSSGDEADPKPKRAAKSLVSRSRGRSQPSRHRDGQPLTVSDAQEDSTSHGRQSGSRTRPSYDEGIIIIIIILYVISICINMLLLVETDGPSRGRQKERSTPKGNKQAKKVTLPHHDEGIIILFGPALVLTSSRYFYG
jgi:hypothetical protein